ncbi:MAG: bifunctional phosphoglucose/phosphomannose isomerase [archaeon]
MKELKELKELKRFPDQIKEAIKLGSIKPRGYNKILVCGMGGSGVVGYILKDLLDVPVFIEQSYEIPKFIDKNTLAFIVSYSGNTEETIAMHKKVKRKTDNIILITSQNKGILYKEKNFIIIPKGFMPRRALAYLFFSIWGCLGHKSNEINGIVKLLKRFNKKDAERLAKKIGSKTPAIYVSETYYSIAVRWKDQINEDAKHIALIGMLPEIDHNEIEANLSRYFPMIIRDKEKGRMDKKIKLTEKIIKAYEIKLKGKTKLEEIFYGIHFGDYLALYLAKLYRENPSKYRNIEKLKRMMK